MRPPQKKKRPRGTRNPSSRQRSDRVSIYRRNCPLIWTEFSVNISCTSAGSHRGRLRKCFVSVDPKQDPKTGFEKANLILATFTRWNNCGPPHAFLSFSQLARSTKMLLHIHPRNVKVTVTIECSSSSRSGSRPANSGKRVKRKTPGRRTQQTTLWNPIGKRKKTRASGSGGALDSRICKLRRGGFSDEGVDWRYVLGRVRFLGKTRRSGCLSGCGGLSRYDTHQCQGVL